MTETTIRSSHLGTSIRDDDKDLHDIHNSKLNRFALKCLDLSCLFLFIPLGVSCTGQKTNESSENQKTKASKPNILLIMVDDLGFSDLGCYGGEIKTPRIDMLASKGLKFTQFYNNSVSVPTRQSLMTGLYSQRNPLFHDRINIGQVMKSSGYQTALIGKWHHPAYPLRANAIDTIKGEPYKVTGAGGFDETFVLWGGAHNYFNPALNDEFHGEKVILDNGHRLREKDFPEDFYITDYLAERASKAIRTFSQNDSPFFISLNFNAPHYPLHAKPEDIEKYKGVYDDGYFALREKRYQKLIKLGLISKKWNLPGPDQQIENKNYDYNIIPWEEVTNLERQKRRMEVYAGMVDAIDQAVGQVLKAIDETGNTDNTVVIFLSDNGGCASIAADQDERLARLGEGLPGPGDTYDFVGPGWGWAQCAPFRRYKLWNYEGGISTPMIVRWPNTVKANTITDQVGHVIDIMPTLIDLTRAEFPSEYEGKKTVPLDGLSLYPVFLGQKRKGHERLYWAGAGGRAVRQGKWKLDWGFTAREWELYDMNLDRTETYNIAGKYPELVVEMSQAWEKWYDQVKLPAKLSK